MSWPLVKLGDYIKPVTGKTPSTSNPDYFNGDLLWVTPGDFKAKLITTSARTLSKKAVDENKCNLLPKNSVIVSCIGDIGKAGILPNGGTTNQQITALIPNDDLNADYLYYCILDKKRELSNLANNAVVPILNNARLKTLEIPLPPLPIQKQIADTLDKADALRRKDQLLLQKYDELAQSIFYEMFGDPVKNEKGWPILKLSEVSNKITDGTHLSPKFLPSGIPFLFVSNIRNNKICYDTDTFISNEEFEVLVKRTPIEVGNILLTTVGSYGNPAIIEKTDKFAFQRHIAFIRPNHNLINYRFLFGIFKSQFVQNQIERKVRGVAQKTLNLLDLKEIEILLPPMELQNKYAETILIMEKLKLKMEQSISEADSLFSSLIQTSFA